MKEEIQEDLTGSSLQKTSSDKPEKTIDTLIEDINTVLKDGVPEVPDSVLQNFSNDLAKVMISRLKREERSPTLRMSNIGKPDRQLWYSINLPEKAEDLRPNTYLKFLYGDLIEELLLFLAELAGHRVEGRQDELEIAGVKGHRDGVIDGVPVDAKSASPYSFLKFKNHLLHIPGNDGFGYIPQLQSYLSASENDPIVTDKKRAAFLAMDKVHGDLALDIHEKDTVDWEAEYKRKKEMVLGPIPERCYEPIPHQQSGNLALPTLCSYCAWKHSCHDNIRTFIYGGKPVFLTKVVREPNVLEVTDRGDIDALDT